ncbi:MAG: phage terminase large subunit family protein, partial [Roseiarcus sp.]
MTSTDSTVNSFCVMKSAQSGFSTLLLAAIAHTICHDKADTMIVQPTDGALSEFNSKKLQPCLEETEATAQRVAKQTSRSASGSTTYEKRFGRYTLTLALASSSADLRSKTIQKSFLDECDEYPDDLDGQGSPFQMLEARQESFLRDGNWKRVLISTPTIKGASAIEAAFEDSDQRRWHVKCRHCSHEFVFAFDSHFHFEEQWPFKAHYSCPECGAVIEEHDRDQMVRAGRWSATAPRPGRKPGYHFDALSSPFVPRSTIVERYVVSSGDPRKLGCVDEFDQAKACG